jgi:hypothetical protein
MVVAVSWLAASASLAQESALAPRNGVLVLRNGHVVKGRITRLGDRYVVAVGQSSEVRFPVGDVEFECGNLEEAYGRKRNILDPGSTRQRLELAEWCLRHEMPHRSADQLLAAMAINPFDARARALRRRLLHLADAREMTVQPQQEPLAEIDWQAIESAVATLPPETVETFTTTVQTLLLNRCGTNACHGSQVTSRYHLMRPFKDKALPQRLTQRNLFATLQMVNPNDPDNSPLLTMPSGPHGGQPEGLFDARQGRQWEQLRDWVHLAARPVVAPAKPQSISIGMPAQSARTGMALSNEVSASSISPHDEIHRSVVSHRPSTENDGEVRFQPRDAFDPTIFNRRYFPENGTPSMANASAEPASKN